MAQSLSSSIVQDPTTWSDSGSVPPAPQKGGPNGHLTPFPSGPKDTCSPSLAKHAYKNMRFAPPRLRALPFLVALTTGSLPPRYVR